MNIGTTTGVTTTTFNVSSSVLNNTCTAILSGTVTILLDLSNAPSFPYTYYQYSFIATSTKTTMMLAIRQDPSYMCLDDISVTNNGTDMWQNGGFELNSLTQYYTYCNPNAASSSGIISTTCPHSGSYSFYDGSVRYSDYLSQSFATVIGSNYNISFWLTNLGGGSNSFLAIIGGGPAGLSARYGWNAHHETKYLLVDSGDGLSERVKSNDKTHIGSIGGAGLCSDGYFLFYPVGNGLWLLDQ
ncbi:unnamed protein product [Rotaria magnacalcarata]|uniref:Uncharacterized protein n=4 Tax=Rotaria magnacalcarata TaxID=392030 RepID=A0A815P2C4_9BILA|nr:unnamed protein product [Rotaria magnacalcarata]